VQDYQLAYAIDILKAGCTCPQPANSARLRLPALPYRKASVWFLANGQGHIFAAQRIGQPVVKPPRWQNATRRIVIGAKECRASRVSREICEENRVLDGGSWADLCGARTLALPYDCRMIWSAN